MLYLKQAPLPTSSCEMIRMLERTCGFATNHMRVKRLLDVLTYWCNGNDHSPTFTMSPMPTVRGERP